MTKMLGDVGLLVVDLAAVAFCASALGANMPNADMITNPRDVILVWNDSGCCCIFRILSRNRNGLLDQNEAHIVALFNNVSSDVAQ